MNNHRGRSAALQWIKNAGLSIASFDGEGKSLALMSLLMEGKWELARESVVAVIDEDFDQCPALRHSVAMARLATTVPPELREAVLSGVPFEVDQIPLASTPAHLEDRRVAQELLSRLYEFARGVGATGAAEIASDYVLWLGLRDPNSDHHSKAIEILRRDLADDATVLRRVNFALRFGVAIDLAKIEEKIDQSIALSGKGNGDAAFARLAIAFAHTNPADAAAYIEKHRSLLYENLVSQAVRRIEIQILAHAGLVGSAQTLLQEAIQLGLTDGDREMLTRALSEANGADPVSERRALYESTGDIRSLENLVSALERARQWLDLLPYAEKSFSVLHSIEAYELVVRCLEELGRHDELLSSLIENQGLIPQSKNLQMLWAWVLYREGRYSESKAVVERYFEDHDPKTLGLRISIAVSSGQWGDLQGLCREGWNNREHYAASSLLNIAWTSHAVSGEHSRDLVIAAAEKEPSNPHVLASAYFRASSTGWEGHPVVSNWLQRAAELSGEDGPLKSVSLDEVIEQKPKWDRHADEVLDQLRRGTIPSFAAGRLLNRSTIDWYLEPSLANQIEPDVRKRSMVIAFSGARQPVADVTAVSLAIDITALITLSRLEILDKVLSRFKLVIPSSTLDWLFKERSTATFHQPSRIKSAATVRALLADGALHVSSNLSSQNHALARLVGADLEALLSMAKARNAEGHRTIVVRPYPVPRIGSSLSEQADLTDFADCLCSCNAIVDYLKVGGALTQDEERKARAYLKLQEKRWPGEPSIATSTEIFLDDLALSHLQNSGVLEKLRTVGLTIYITQDSANEAAALVGLESLGEKKLHHIDQLRRAIADGLLSGRIVARRPPNNPSEDPTLRSHPTHGVIGVSRFADAMVVDDRFINKHGSITLESIKPVLCSLDLLDVLRQDKSISELELYSYRTVLRRFGYQLIEIKTEELLYHINYATVADGRFIESAELRAIRESMMKARMTSIVQLPQEAAFLHNSLSAYVACIKAIWTKAPDVADAKVRADYLLEQVDIRCWAGSVASGSERDFSLFGHAMYMTLLASPPLEAEEVRLGAYFEWVTEMCLKPIQRNQPEMYPQIVSRFRDMALSLTEKSVRGAAGSSKYKKKLRASMLAEYLRHVPPLIRDGLLADGVLREQFGLDIDGALNFVEVGASFKRSEVVTAVKAATSDGAGRVALTDSGGFEWVVSLDTSNAVPDLVFTSTNHELRVDRLLALSERVDIRQSFFEHEAIRINLSEQAKENWRGKVLKRAFSIEETTQFLSEVSNTPVAVAESIEEAFRRARISISALVPRSVAYYEQLVGAAGGHVNVLDYAAGVGAAHISSLLKWDNTAGLQQALLMCSHSVLVDVIASQSLASKDFKALSEWALTADPISQAAVLELAIKNQNSSSAAGKGIQLLASKFVAGLRTEKSSPFQLLSAAFVMVDGELAVSRILASKPPFWRRLAALAHAAVIVRCVLSMRRDDVSGLVNWMASSGEVSYSIQALVDRRLEPRWSPEFGRPVQLVNELGGRLYGVASVNSRSCRELGLSETVLGEEPQSLRSQVEVPLIFLPGPLEGNTQPSHELDHEHAEKIRTSLATSIVTAESFSLLINAVMLFRIPADIPGLAASALERANYHLDDNDTERDLDRCLLGIANVAAITRSHELADAVIACIFRYRQLFKDELSVDVAFQAGLTAAASRKDLSEWCITVGRVISGLAFSVLSSAQAQGLHRITTDLCDLVPELWATCGRAIAAMEAVFSGSLA